jgi:hypothetical protein
MNTTLCIEALEARDLFSASLALVAPAPEPTAGDGSIVYVGCAGGGAWSTADAHDDTFTTQPGTAEAKEQFTRTKPHVNVGP